MSSTVSLAGRGACSEGGVPVTTTDPVDLEFARDFRDPTGVEFLKKLGAGRTKSKAEAEQQEKDQRWLESHSEELIAEHPAEWVGVHHEMVVAHHADLNEFVDLLKARGLLDLNIAADRMIPRK